MRQHFCYISRKIYVSSPTVNTFVDNELTLYACGLLHFHRKNFYQDAQVIDQESKFIMVTMTAPLMGMLKVQ